MSSIKTNSPLNYIDLLPSELLAHIFTILQDLDEDKVQNEILTTPVYPLGLVCKTWYSAVLSTPQLWASISFDIPGSSVPRFEGGILRSHGSGRVTAPGGRPWRSKIRSLKKFLQRWLNRSGNLPLEISVVYPTFVDGLMLLHPDLPFQSTSMSSTTHRLPLHPIIGYLNSYSSRWLILRLRNFPVALLDQFKGAQDLPSSKDCPLLQELSISNGYSFEDVTTSGSGACFDPWNVKACPRKISLESTISATFLHVCYARLTILELRLMNQEDLFEIIQQAVEVEICLLNEMIIDDMRPPFDGFVLLKNIRRFHLTSLDDSPTTILEHFAMPNLEALSIRVDQDPDASIAIVDLLSRSGCSLQELRLSFARLAEVDLVFVLEHTPALRSLAITGLPESLGFEVMDFLGNMMGEFFQTYIASGSGSGTLGPQALSNTSNNQAGAQDQAQTGASRPEFLSNLNRFEYDGPFLFSHGILDTFRDTFNSRGVPSPSNTQAGSPLSQGQNFPTYGSKISVTLERVKPSQWNLNAS